jgi:acyl-CoA reductase-like NAD-dependent aldehyde dehydrogenase
MASIAEESLADKEIPFDPAKPQFRRFLRREPLGVVLVIPAWNYPYLTAVNGIVPALLAGILTVPLSCKKRIIGNTVVLKHSQQTPLCAERIAEACKAAGFPEGVFQV